MRTLPRRLNYIGIFLTLRCPRRCPECLNEYSSATVERTERSAAEWITGLNKLHVAVPVTFNGGEPLSHCGFYDIVNGISNRLKIDLLTTLPGSLEQFLCCLRPERFTRELPYPSIRVTFHPATMSLRETTNKVQMLLSAGFAAGIYLVDDPSSRSVVSGIKHEILSQGISCTIKPFLGYRDGRLHGQYRYDLSVAARSVRFASCRPSVLLVDPHGDIYRCHGDLLRRTKSGRVGNLIDDQDVALVGFTECDHFGLCHPCDVQIKYNRLGYWGYTAVEIVGSGVVENKLAASVDWR